VELDDALISWCELTPALVVNRPAAMSSNESKPYQAGLIAAAGLRIPDTLITNDPEQAEAFWAEHRDVIYKSCSGVSSVVQRFNPADRERLRKLRWCPTQFQRRIAGVDYRVHVVGEEIFACRIESGADDYRYDSGAKVVACTLDPTVPEAEPRPRAHGGGLGPARIARWRLVLLRGEPVPWVQLLPSSDGPTHRPGDRRCTAGRRSIVTGDGARSLTRQ